MTQDKAQIVDISSKVDGRKNPAELTATSTEISHAPSANDATQKCAVCVISRALAGS